MNSSVVYKDQAFGEYAKRIATFLGNDPKCCAWPVDLSPAVCSQYGWVCVRPGLLRCSSCNTSLRLTIPDASQSDYDSCLRAAQQCLARSAHRSHCPWIFNPSPDRFVRMILQDKREALEEFLNNSATLIPSEELLPRSEDGQGMTEDDYGCLLSHLDGGQTIFLRNLVNWAFSGWCLQCDASHLECMFCQRQIRLCRSTSDREPEVFRPELEHRSWCRWALHVKQAATSRTTVPGWQKFRTTLLSCCKTNKV